MTLPAAEWAAVTADQVVIATPTRLWTHRPRAGDPWDLFSQPMQGAGSPVTTRRLLRGSIAAAPGGSPEPQPPTSPAEWAWRLCGMYHTTHATPDRMARAAERFEARGRPRLAAWARHKTRDEAGHDTLALRDLAALVPDARAWVAQHRPRRAAALVEYFESCVSRPHPIACLGYAFALEAIAAGRSGAYVRAVQRAVAEEGPDVTRCLRVHSGAGSDAAHVAELEQLVASLPAADRTATARACHTTARILFDPQLADEPPALPTCPPPERA